MKKDIIWMNVLWLIMVAVVGFGSFFWGTNHQKDVQALELPKVQTEAYVQAACAATEQKLGTCQLRIAVPADSIGLAFEQYAIVGGVVLRDNGEKQAEATELPSACFAGDCTISLPEGSEEAPPAAVQSPAN